MAHDPLDAARAAMATTHGDHICSPNRLSDEVVCPPAIVIVSLFGFWCMSVAIAVVMRKWTKFYRTMVDVGHERNCTGYVMNLLVTTVSLVMVLAKQPHHA